MKAAVVDSLHLRMPGPGRLKGLPGPVPAGGMRPMGQDGLRLGPDARRMASQAPTGQAAAATPANEAAQGASWANGKVFYQIFPDRFQNGDRTNDPAGVRDWERDQPDNNNHFGGDLRGIINKLPYLKDLGIEALYLNPIFAGEGNHKYGTLDYYKIDPQFGSLADFDELVAKAHASGIKVVLDGVFNHVASNHPWFQDALKNGPGSAHWNDFLFHGPAEDPARDYEAFFGYRNLPKLNVAGNQQVQQAIMDVTTFWMKRGVDGWRLDAPTYIDSDDFWHKWRATVKDLKPDAYIVGEAWDIYGQDGTPWLQGDKFDGITNFSFLKHVVDWIGHGTIDVDAFDGRMRDLRGHYNPLATSQMFNHIDNHDTTRFAHETLGSREKQKMAAVAQMTMPGNPVIYYGDEIGMGGANDPDDRKPMAWKHADLDLHDHYQQLIALRKAHPALADPSYPDTIMRHNQLGQLAYTRTDGKETMLVAINTGASDHLDLDTTTNNLGRRAFPDGTKFVDVLNGGTATSTGGRVSIPVPPAGSAILQVVLPA